jgi:hypothetical protein
MQELLAKLQTADALLALTPQRLDAILLRCIRERVTNTDPIAYKFIYQNELDSIYPVGLTTPYAKKRDVDAMLMEAWQRLRSDGFLMQAPGQPNGVMTLTAKGKEAADAVNFDEMSARQALRREVLHPDLRGSVYTNFANGAYDTAVREAMVLIEDAVRTAANLPHSYFGVRLMREAFDPTNGPLTDQTLQPRPPSGG